LNFPYLLNRSRRKKSTRA